MGRKVKDTGGGDFKKVPEGTHKAVCNMVVVLDDQVREWNGERSIVDQVYLRFETPDERLTYTTAEGEEREGPLSIGKLYTSSLAEKANLRKDLQGWRNRAFTKDELKGFDIENVLGKCCQIVVTHKESNGNVYANISSIAGWPKGMDPIPAENPLIYYDPDKSDHYDDLPKWLKEKIESSVERAQGLPPSPEDEYLNGGEEPHSDIPF